MTDQEKQVLDFLARTPRVDRRWLSEERIAELTKVLGELHNGKKLSLLRISKLTGKSYTKVWGIYHALGIHTRSLAEADTLSAVARSKHRRTPFSGSEEDRAYMVGFANGDLTPLQVSGTAVMVSATTTHPAFIALFHELYHGYGHIYQYPMHEEVKGYKWRLAVRLDNSFRFLLMNAVQSCEYFSGDDSLFWSWLAGIVDSDGHVHIANSGGNARVGLSIANTDYELLSRIKRELESRGFHPTGPYLQSAAGKITPSYNIRYSKDMWNLQLQSTPESQTVLRSLPLRLREKVGKKALAVSISRAAKWSDVGVRVLRLREAVLVEVKESLAEARRAYLTRAAEARS